MLWVRDEINALWEAVLDLMSLIVWPGAGGLCMAVMILSFGLPPEGVLKINEIAPGVYRKRSSISNGAAHPNGTLPPGKAI